MDPSDVTRPSQEVFAYLDYRSFLRERFAFEKERSAVFSYRYVSRKVGVRSPAHLKRIIDGERRLTDAMALRYAQVFRLSDEEQRYFASLVRFNNAKSTTAREAAYKELSQFRSFREFHRLEEHQADFCAHWYIPAIRELVVCRGFQDDAAWIAKALRPEITAREATAALRTLLELGLLARTNHGLVQASPTVTTGAQTQWVHVIRYHRAMLERASESIDVFAAAQRDISAVTLAVPADAIVELKERIAAFRRSLLSEYEGTENAEQLLQLNIQLFPLSARSEQ